MINTFQCEQVGKIRYPYFFLGKSQQVNHQAPIFTPVNGATVTSQADQNNPLIPVRRNGFETVATVNSQKPINPFRKAAKGTENDTMIVILDFDKRYIVRMPLWF